MSNANSTTIAAVVTPEVEYRLCPGRNGYRVGTDGTVWSNKRKPRGPSVWDGNWYRLNPVTMKDTGRQAVTINGKLIYVHRLVLEAFVGPRPQGFQACHEDGDPTNNFLSNLRWDTPKNNQADRDRHGRTTKGSRHGATSITEDTVRAIKAAAVSTPAYGRYITLASRFGTTRNIVKSILMGKSWTHVV